MYGAALCVSCSAGVASAHVHLSDACPPVLRTGGHAAVRLDIRAETQITMRTQDAASCTALLHASVCLCTALNAHLPDTCPPVVRAAHVLQAAVVRLDAREAHGVQGEGGARKGDHLLRGVHAAPADTWGSQTRGVLPRQQRAMVNR